MGFLSLNETGAQADGIPGLFSESRAIFLSKIQEQIAIFFRQDCGNLFVTFRDVSGFARPAMKQ